MNSMFRAAAALALTGATLPALAASATATRAFDFKPESNAGLTVRNLIGDIRVVRGDTPGIRITATATVETESQAEADAAASDHRECRFQRHRRQALLGNDGVEGSHQIGGGVDEGPVEVENKRRGGQWRGLGSASVTARHQGRENRNQKENDQL